MMMYLMKSATSYTKQNQKVNTLQRTLKINSKLQVMNSETKFIYFNTVFSDDFWTEEPDRYPHGYYGFSNRIRTHIFLGQRIRFDVPEKYRKFSKSITAFYEISSCDFYLVSAFTNSYLTPLDYLRLSFGLKFQIF